MAVTDQVIFLALGFAFAYLVEQSDKGLGVKIVANMIYSLIGMIMMYYSVVVLADQYVGAAIGLILFLGGIVKLIVEIFPDKQT